MKTNETPEPGATASAPAGLLADEIIQGWIDDAKRHLPKGEVAMTQELLPPARIIALGSNLLKAKHLLSANVRMSEGGPVT